MKITAAWYWSDGRVAWMADGKMFTCNADTPWGQHLIESGIVK
jgi:hypothetical protein